MSDVLGVLRAGQKNEGLTLHNERVSHFHSFMAILNLRRHRDEEAAVCLLGLGGLMCCDACECSISKKSVIFRAQAVQIRCTKSNLVRSKPAAQWMART
jgi:hypothetical protein